MRPTFATPRVLFAFAVCALGLPASAAPAAAPAAAGLTSVVELRAWLEAHVTQPRFSGSLWSVRIDSLDTGAILFAHHADRAMAPASNSKLYAGALALDELGAEYRIVTPILATAKPDDAGVVHGEVIVSGRGDPSWKSAQRREDFWPIFAPFVTALKQAGVRRITGDLVADTTHFHAPPNGTGWMVDDLNNDYGAEISALTIENNYADARVTPAARAGEPCVVELLHPLTELTLDNRMMTVAAGAGRQLVAHRHFDENVVHLFGQLPVGGKVEIVDLTVPRPAAWFARALKEALARGGIGVGGRARSVRWPEAPAASVESVQLGEVSSPPMRELVAAFMKPSQNLETDLIFGHLGEKRRTADLPTWRTTEELAVEALREFFRRNALPAHEVRLAEGSGLSQYNLTTANATVGLLTVMAKHRAAADFLAALPVAGIDGTLRLRMKGTAAAGNVRAKTGALRHANTLSGFVTTAAGERLVFSIMLNRHSQTPPNRNAREELDDIAVRLAEYRGAR